VSGLPGDKNMTNEREAHMKIEMVRTDSLKPAPYNAPVRTQQRELAVLLEDIEGFGIEHPLTVDGDNQIIDGHRRWACAVKLGIEFVPVIRKVNPRHDLYAVLEDTRRGMSGKEAPYVFLNGGPVTRSHAKRLKHLMDVGGGEMVQRLFDLNLSPAVWEEAARAAKHCGVDWKADKKAMRMILTYLIEGRRQALVHQAITSGVSPTVLWDAIRAGRELRAEYK
jgi:hypothetical protein